MTTEQFQDERRQSDTAPRRVEPFVGLQLFMADSAWFDAHWYPRQDRPARGKRRTAHRALAFVAGFIVLTAGGSLVAHHYAPPPASWPSK